MSTFVLIHGGGDVGWSWHLVAAELRARGHDVLAPDLPGDDESKTLADYADAVVEAVGDKRDLVVVGHSFGAFTAPLVADRLPVDVLVLLAGMIPSPGESPDEWWANTGYQGAMEEQAERDGGLTGNADPFVSFYHDVPRKLAEEAMGKERDHPSRAASAAPWPLDAWPNVPTRFVLCGEDRFFPPDFFRRLVPERLGIVPDEIAGGHCVALSRPEEVADLLAGYAATASSAPPTDMSNQRGARPRPNSEPAAGEHGTRHDLFDYDAELRAHNELFRAAARVGSRDRVLDIGCGTGQSTREAARAAVTGSVVGVDLSAPMLERARQLSDDQGLPNITYQQADAQVHRFLSTHFDLCISRFGAMFFADPVAAFTNIGRALRPGARLVLLVWQDRDRNEWASAIRRSLTAATVTPAPPTGGPGPFSLADPTVTRGVLAAAGFTRAGFADVHEPVFYGPDTATAFDNVLRLREYKDLLADLGASAEERARARLRATLAAHNTGSGVYFDSRAWIITARRGP